MQGQAIERRRCIRVDKQTTGIIVSALEANQTMMTQQQHQTIRFRAIKIKQPSIYAHTKHERLSGSTFSSFAA
jgi:hypothetical protein